MVQISQNGEQYLITEQVFKNRMGEDENYVNDLIDKEVKEKVKIGVRKYREVSNSYKVSIINEVIGKKEQVQKPVAKAKSAEGAGKQKVETKVEAKKSKEKPAEITGDAAKDAKTIASYLAEIGQKIAGKKIRVKDVEEVYLRAKKKYKKHGFIGVVFEVLASLQELKIKKNPKRNQKRNR